MNTTTLKEFYDDPALRGRFYRFAARERARAVREGFAHALGGVTWLLAHLKPRRPMHWIERLG